MLNWTARVLSIAAIVPLMLIVFGENGHGPSGLREWIYLALFPFAFSAGYVIAWRRPLLGGTTSLVCMIASLLVIGKTFDMAAYGFWAILSVPALLFIAAGLSRPRPLL